MSTLVQPEPAAFDRVLDAGAELLAAGFGRGRVEERRVDLLNVDAAVLHSLDADGEFDQLTGCGFRLGKGRSAVSFMNQP